MFRIIVASDSHGNVKYIEDIIDNIKDINLIVHLGDYVRDAEYLESLYPEYKHAYVRGNCDYSSNVQDEKILTAEGFKILLTHGHGYGVKSGTDSLLRYAVQKEVNCVLFGHTHQKKCEWIENILFLNPGSGQFGSSSPAIGIIEIENNELNGCVL